MLRNSQHIVFNVWKWLILFAATLNAKIPFWKTVHWQPERHRSSDNIPEKWNNVVPKNGITNSFLPRWNPCCKSRKKIEFDNKYPIPWTKIKLPISLKIVAYHTGLCFNSWDSLIRKADLASILLTNILKERISSEISRQTWDVNFIAKQGNLSPLPRLEMCDR